jgi:thymidylate synthase ThyX
VTGPGITAEVVCDSTSPLNHRLFTVVVRFPRSIADEVLTHASLSRNARSSRATPVGRMIEEVERDPYTPVKWQRAQKGMQGGDEIDEVDRKTALNAWLDARDFAVRQARILLDVGLHKTVPNRLLEPFAWQTMIISGTDAAWLNFFNQRCSPAADPPMEMLARAINAVYAGSTPRRLQPGEWHLPFIRDEDRREFPAGDIASLKTLAHLSAARCARVSYNNHFGVRSTGDDLRLYHDTLMSAVPPHWSPLEHPAMVVPPSLVPTRGKFDGDWAQLRHLQAMH